ncbi:sodium/solute symporter [Ruficoccus amylovorans]|uniref:Sodium/solute symporter n=1 Tax=Ruficoccus amylovorans TaxID=1804625 RepID=A0A842HGY4_9BACT|nr:sodium/solute symporter [Ruficoccus amylovorans]MBC2595985.1 sodium/solute symporter [Ruficoccus amylovorans]
MNSFLLEPVNLAIMVLYFVSMLGIGVFFSRRTKTTMGYFIGNRNIPTWVLGLSMISAMISSVTFLAMPAAAYVLDWRQFTPNLSILVVAALAVWLIIPFFRSKATKTTAYEYLNARFGRSARLYGAIMSLVGQGFRLGAVIYLMSIPLHMMTGVPIAWVIIVAGAFCTVYTILGGIEAVIWTDAVQGIILYLGGFAVLVVMLLDIPGGLPEVFRVAGEYDKFSLGAIEWDVSERTFWSMMIIGTFGWITMYTSDQVQIQRFLAAKDLREARRAGWLSALLCLPTWAFFFFIGTTMFVFYKLVPDPAVAGLSADEVLPHFILTRMPTGLNSFVIAGILSAAMGSLSAGLNAFATVATSDIIRPYLLKNRSDAFYKRTARLMTALAALIMFVLGFVFAFSTKESFMDYSQRVLGMIGGVVPGFFLLGFFAPRVNRRILWKAFWCALVLNVYLVLVQMEVVPPLFGVKIHPYMVTAVVVSFMVCFAVALSLIQRSRRENVEGLTIFSNPKTNGPGKEFEDTA